MDKSIINQFEYFNYINIKYFRHIRKSFQNLTEYRKHIPRFIRNIYKYIFDGNDDTFLLFYFTFCHNAFNFLDEKNKTHTHTQTQTQEMKL